MPPRKSKNELIAEIEALQARVEELEEVLRAIRSGEVDAILSSGPEGERVFSLTGAESTYRIILETINEGSITLSPDGIILYSNSRFSEMLKAPLEKIIGSSFHDFMDEHGRDKLTRLLKRGLKKGSNYETVLLDRNGAPLPVYLSVNPLPSGEVASVSMIVTDISERKKAEEALRRAYEELEYKVKERTAELSEANKNLRIEVAERRRMEEALLMSEETLLLAIRATDLGTFDYYPESGELLWSERAKRHFGLPPDATINYEIFLKAVHHDDRKRVHDAVQEAFRPEGSGEYKLEYRTIGIQDKKERWLSAQGQVYFNNERKPVRFIGTTLDITARKRMEDDIRHLAHHDSLTDLPNRILFSDILNRELAHARRNQKKLAVLFLDLDKFKLINDTLGHDFGDMLLKQVGDRLRQSVRQSDTVARIGGDEFNILMTDVPLADDVIFIARKILESFGEPFIVGGRELHARTSIGISIYPDDAENTESLFKNADIAMYHAKDRGGNNYQFYSSSMNIRTFERIRLESWLRHSLPNGELEIYYQPQFDIESRQVLSAEALVRWRHPEQGLLAPKDFIPLAEETGFITHIDEWVLRTAAAQFRQWRNAGFLKICLTVNLSAKEFQKPDLSERIGRILEDTGFDPRDLDLEISESTVMRDIGDVTSNIARMVEMGIAISVDDFGTGYSSFNYLTTLPVHKLKIDRSFISGIATDPNDRILISAVAAMARNMNLKVTAVGVETEEQLQYIRSAGCQEIQGYLLGRPLPAEEFGDLVRSHIRSLGQGV